jgi:hypothetical protein
MAPKCFQSLDNGQRCSAPALNDSKFCRHHDPRRPQQEIKDKSRESEPLFLPPLFDKPSMLAAVNQVVQALAEGRIKRSVADTLLSAIKFANRLLTEIADAGLSVYPTQQPAVGRQTGVSSNYITGAVALAASGDHGKAADAYQPSDRLVEEMMAQAQELLAKAPKPDPDLRTRKPSHMY